MSKDPITGNMHTCKVCKRCLHGSLCARPFHKDEEEDPYKGHMCLDCTLKEVPPNSTSGVAASVTVAATSSDSGDLSQKKVKCSIPPLPKLLQMNSMDEATGDIEEQVEHKRINSLAMIADNPSVDLEICTKAWQQVNAYLVKEVQVAASAMQQNNKDDDGE